MRFALMVTGPAYGTQQASSAYQFAVALLAAGHTLGSVFFYREGVSNANALTAPASDEFDLVRAWQNCTTNSRSNCIFALLRRFVAVWLIQRKHSGWGFLPLTCRPGFR